ncbi:MAG TPA: DUF952 domain-containing protein [Myxococcales bacterium]|nr:hypothetical protein [Deltaproteobacteria bacterium]MBU51134.1 hypothetical protein [Deltaproteobacteria bacterium]HAA58827.1 DUF952 domain-containing protein [Myxococcales bacterium]
MIYHITEKLSWEGAQEKGKYTAPSLELEGFIHCSTREQIVQTANNFYKGQQDLVLLCIDEDSVTDVLKYEAPVASNDPGAGLLFPHVYAPIDLASVYKVVDFPCESDGSFRLPETL